MAFANELYVLEFCVFYFATATSSFFEVVFHMTADLCEKEVSKPLDEYLYHKVCIFNINMSIVSLIWHARVAR